MAEKTVVVSQPGSRPIRLVKWKVREGCPVSIGTLVLLYHFDGAKQGEQRKLKSTQAGTVYKLLSQEGAIVKAGGPLFELEPCIHPTVMKDMCAECGADLRKSDLNSTASVPMVHSVPELKVSEELALKIGKQDGERLLRDKKLVLLVDLDQTLIHTTNDIIPPNLKDVYHFQLYGPHSLWYHTRLRPGTHKFLTNISPFFELHICTFGARNYAHKITTILDGDGRFFSNRVLSRDECFNPTSKKANLKALFPCGDHMVCIIDDREDVWSHATNLIHVKPYHFFQHTGDINAPPGLEKDENDDVDGVDLSKVKIPTETEEKKVDGSNKTQNDSELSKKIPCEAEEKKVDGGNNKAQNDSEDIDEVDLSKKIPCEAEEKKVDDGNKTQDDSEDIDVVDLSKVKIASETEEDKVDGCDKPQNNADQSKEGDEEKNDGDEKNDKQTNDENLMEISDECEEPQKPDDEKAQPDSGEKEKVTQNGTTTKNGNNSEVENSDKTDGATPENMQPKPPELLEIDDPDDYLLYLEDILKRIHSSFYEEYDKMESGEVPDLKKVIPKVKNEVLTGVKMVFSGLVPTHLDLLQSRAYMVAKSLGADVTPNLGDDTTHLVAVRPGTAKVNAGRRKKLVKIVTPDWLWACAERWEHVEEKLYPLNSKGSKNRHPPAHCSSPEHVPSYPTHANPAARKRSPSGRFMDTINPLMSFSSADIADMDKEVEDMLDSEDSESTEDELVARQMELPRPLPITVESSSSSDESLTAELPRGFKRNRERLKADQDETDNALQESEDEFPSTKFRRGEPLSSDLDFGQDSNSEGSVEAPDEIDDVEWNSMGAALEREFLSNT